MVTNTTAAELARRLEKEGVVVVSFFAGGRACRAQQRLHGTNRALSQAAGRQFACFASTLGADGVRSVRVILPC